MASLSDLNKRERSIRREISQLRKQLRKKEISRKDFESSLGSRKGKLERISEEKGRLIGEALPPIPLPPRPPARRADAGLDSIKKSILGKEKPGGSGPPRSPFLEEARPKPKPKVRAKEVKAPVIKERIKKVPVKVPVVKERIRTVRVPAGDPALAKRIEESFREIGEMRSDIARQEESYSNITKDIDGIKKRVLNLNEMRAEVKALRMRIDKIDFQGLTKEIYNQFEKMNSSIRESEKKTDDLVEKMNVEIKTLREKMEETSQAKEHVEGLEVSHMKRDMESLKQKSQYIEQHLERVDVKPIVEMIQEVERKVDSLRASSALIIE
jgi:chromosome segregation ATPase